jgi:hypothetical protein
MGIPPETEAQVPTTPAVAHGDVLQVPPTLPHMSFGSGDGAPL